MNRMIALTSIIFLLGCEASDPVEKVPWEAVAPSDEIRVTLAAEQMPLRQVLERFRSATNRDLRTDRDSQEFGDVPITLDFRDTPFWQAVAQLSSESGLGLDPNVSLVLTESYPCVEQHQVMARGLLAAWVEEAEHPDGQPSTWVRLTFYHDLGQASYLKPSDIIASCTSESETPMIAYHNEVESSGWAQSWDIMIPGEHMTTGLSLTGKLRGDFHSRLRRFILPCQSERHIIVDDTTVLVDGIEQEDAEQAKVAFRIRWDNQLSDEDMATLVSIQQKVLGSGRRLPSADSDRFQSIMDRAKRVAVSKILVFESDGSRAKTSSGFTGSSDFDAGEAQIWVTAPMRIVRDGRIELVLADVRAEEFSFVLDIEGRTAESAQGE